MTAEQVEEFQHTLTKYTAQYSDGYFSPNSEAAQPVTARCTIEDQILAGETNDDDNLFNLTVIYTMTFVGRNGTNVDDYDDRFERWINNATNIVRLKNDLKNAGIEMDLLYHVTKYTNPTRAPSLLPSPGPSVHTAEDPSSAPTTSPTTSPGPSVVPTAPPLTSPSPSRHPSAMPLTGADLPSPTMFSNKKTVLALGVAGGCVVLFAATYCAWKKGRAARKRRNKRPSNKLPRDTPPGFDLGAPEGESEFDSDSSFDRSQSGGVPHGVLPSQSLDSMISDGFGGSEFSGDTSEPNTGISLKHEFNDYRNTITGGGIGLGGGLGGGGIGGTMMMMSGDGHLGPGADPREDTRKVLIEKIDFSPQHHNTRSDLSWIKSEDPYEIEATALYETSDWKKRKQGANESEKREFAKKMMRRMVSSVGHGVINPEDASRIIDECFALLGLPVEDEIPRTCLIVTGMAKKADTEKLRNGFEEFGEIEGSAVAEGKGFGIVRFKSPKYAIRAMEKYHSDYILVEDVAVVVRMLEPEPEAQSEFIYELRPTNNSPRRPAKEGSGFFIIDSIPASTNALS